MHLKKNDKTIGFTMINKTEWLANRRNYLGASEVAAVLGKDPFRTPASVWAAKVHGEPSDNDNDAMSFGRDVETAIANLYTRRTGVELCGIDNTDVVCHPKHDWIGATLDRWIKKDGIAIPHEIKNVGSYNWYEKYQTWEEDPPINYVIQVQTQCACTGADHGFLIGMFPGYQLAVARIEYSQEFWDAAEPKLVEFWEAVKRREPPEPTVGDDLDALKRVLVPVEKKTVELTDADSAVFDRFEIVKKEIKILSDKKKLLEACIRVALGDAEYGTLPDGRRAKVSIINRAGYTVEPKTYSRLSILKAKNGKKTLQKN
jgi:putative phage-type endonuclease